MFLVCRIVLLLYLLYHLTYLTYLLQVDNDIVGEKEVHSFLQYHVDDMIERANELRDNNVNAPELPLIRLRYEFNSLTIPINSAKFGLEYLNRVANPNDILLSVKRKDYSSGDNKSTARSG